MSVAGLQCIPEVSGQLQQTRRITGAADWGGYDAANPPAAESEESQRRALGKHCCKHPRPAISDPVLKRSGYFETLIRVLGTESLGRSLGSATVHIIKDKKAIQWTLKKIRKPRRCSTPTFLSDNQLGDCQLGALGRLNL